MTGLSNKDLAFLTLVLFIGGLLSWLLFYSLVVGVVCSSLALMSAVLCLVLTRWVGVKVLSFVTISAAGALGMLLGCVIEFGQTGLFSLSSLCLTVAEQGGMDAAWRMFLLAPVVHLGMWLGCSIALASSLRSRWLDHIFCTAGMVIGMSIGANFSVSAFELPAELLVITTVAWMWIWMSVGMTLPHWWCIRTQRLRGFE